MGKQTLIFPDSLLVVDGALGRHRSGNGMGGWDRVA